MTRLPRAMREALDGHLAPGEPVRGTWVAGSLIGFDRSGALVCAEDRCLVISRDPRSWGWRVAVVPYSGIETVRVTGPPRRSSRRGLVEVEVVPRGAERPADGRGDPALTLRFLPRWSQRAIARRVTAVLTEAVADARRHEPQPQPQTMPCPECRETIPVDSIVCRYCGQPP